MQEKLKSNLDKIAEKGKKRLDEYYAKKLRKSRYLKLPTYQEEVKIDNSLKVF